MRQQRVMLQHIRTHQNKCC